MTGLARRAKATAACTGAPLTYEGMWDQINWNQVTKEVWRLQVRIAKVTQAGRKRISC